MNHQALTAVARVIEKHFPQNQKINFCNESLTAAIKHIATHLPHLSPKSNIEEFLKLDELQGNIKQINVVSEFLLELADAISEE